MLVYSVDIVCVAVQLYFFMYNVCIHAAMQFGELKDEHIGVHYDHFTTERLTKNVQGFFLLDALKQMN